MKTYHCPCYPAIVIRLWIWSCKYLCQKGVIVPGMQQTVLNICLRKRSSLRGLGVSVIGWLYIHSLTLFMPAIYTSVFQTSMLFHYLFAAPLISRLWFALISASTVRCWVIADSLTGYPKLETQLMACQKSSIRWTRHLPGATSDGNWS